MGHDQIAGYIRGVMEATEENTEAIRDQNKILERIARPPNITAQPTQSPLCLSVFITLWLPIKTIAMYLTSKGLYLGTNNANMSEPIPALRGLGLSLTNRGW